MIEGFVFLEPSWMILMIFPLGWIVLNQRHEALKRKDLRAYCEMGSRPWLEVQKKNRRQRSRQRWLFLAIIITVLGTMRPSWNPQPQPLTEEGRDLIFILDVSKSMLAQDARPSRLPEDLFHGQRTCWQDPHGRRLAHGNAALARARG